MSCTVRTVADVQAVARAHGLSTTDHTVTDVHGQWVGPGCVLSATEDAHDWVRVTVQARGPDDRLVFQTRFEGTAQIEWVHDVVGVALAGHKRAVRTAA